MFDAIIIIFCVLILDSYGLSETTLGPTVLPTTLPIFFSTTSFTSTKEPASSFPTSSFTCECLGVISDQDNYCKSEYTFGNENGCEQDVNCTWGFEGSGGDNLECDDSISATSSTFPPTTNLPTSQPSSNPSNASSIQVVYTGYLTDTLCLTKNNDTVVSNDGITFLESPNITTNAPLHTIACMQNNVCVDSGFTVLEQTSTNLFVAKYQISLSFSDVLKVVKVLESARCFDNFTVTVTGIENGPAQHNGLFTYNDGAQSLGTQLKLENITGNCGSGLQIYLMTVCVERVTHTLLVSFTVYPPPPSHTHTHSLSPPLFFGEIFSY